MPFEVRDNDRYGSYPVTVEGIGDCQFIIDISGFGESFVLEKEGEELFFYDTGEHEFENEIETEEGYVFNVGFPYYQTVKIPYSMLRKKGE